MNQPLRSVTVWKERRKKTLDETEAFHNRSVLANKIIVPELHADGSRSDRIEEQKQLRAKRAWSFHKKQETTTLQRLGDKQPQ
jgi:hypothetical protein